MKKKKEIKETEVKFFAKDECYCDWYRCLSCKDTMITKSSNYCPNCGKKIIK